MRPPPLVRAGVLVAAVTFLGLAMCVRGQQAKAPAPGAEPQAAPARVNMDYEPAMVQKPAAPPDAAPEPPKKRPEYFNATKAPGFMY